MDQLQPNDTIHEPIGLRSEKFKKEVIVIDLTLSDTENEPENDPKPLNIQQEFTPFDPPLYISGNILESRHYKILRSRHSWFTDDIINAFFCILKAKSEGKCFVFSSFFYNSLLDKGKKYCLKHWTKGIRAFLNTSLEDKIVLLPVNSGGSHWVLVAWYVYEGTLKYYDSLMCKRAGKLIMKKMTEFFNEMLKREYNEDEEETIDNLLSKLSLDNTNAPPIIRLNLIPKGQMQQTDGSSCGPICCLNGKSLVEQDDQSSCDIYEFREHLIEYFKENALIFN